MTALRVAELFIYPVKSFRGQSVATAVVEARGLRDDRRWMLVDQHGKFMSQRTLPALARFTASIEPRGQHHRLSIEHVDGARMHIDSDSAGESIDVSVWSDTVRAHLPKHAIHEQLSELLGQAARLVYMPDDSLRNTDPTYSQPGDIVSFADGFPVLVTTTASLQAVRALTGQDIDRRQFRPNIVVTNDEPWQEEQWSQLQIGEMVLDLVKPCTRCVMTTLHPDTGEQDTNRQPLKALAGNKRGHQGVVFGMNAIARRLGAVKIDDAVQPKFPDQR